MANLAQVELANSDPRHKRLQAFFNSRRQRRFERANDRRGRLLAPE